MSKTVNIYTASVMGNDGTVLKMDEVRAPNKRDAARLMHCNVSDVELVKAHVTREFNEAYIDRLMNNTIAGARLNTIRVFKSRRSYFTLKEIGAR